MKFIIGKRRKEVEKNLTTRFYCHNSNRIAIPISCEEIKLNEIEFSLEDAKYLSAIFSDYVNKYSEINNKK